MATFLQTFLCAFFYYCSYCSNVAKHEISKWRPNSRWTLKRFYRLKLVNLIIFFNSWFFGSGAVAWNVLIFGYVILIALFYCKKICCQSWKIKMAYIFKIASKMFIFITQYFQKWYFCPFFFFCFFLYFGWKQNFSEKTFFFKIQNGGMI
jgi:O-antigen/teichoic acid export membrane protein